MTVLLLIAASGLVLAMLVSTTILIPTFLFRASVATRPSEWWYAGISFLVGFLVSLAIFAPGSRSNEMGFLIVIASLIGVLMSMFGALWHKSGVGYERTEPRSSSIARLFLLIYLAAFVVLGAIALHPLVAGG